VSVSLQGVAELGTARLYVVDNGVGIDPAALPKIFEAFSQADRSIDRDRGGLGLGLALVEGLVELHGGRVTAKSAGLGSGSEFMVELPVYDHLSDAAGGEHHTQPATSTAQRIVLIDDNRDLADSTRMVLELSGHKVHVAYSGAEGIAAVRRLAPQVIICDIGLPGMSGYDVCRQLCSDGGAASSLKIALSGHGSNSNKEQAIEAGFDLFLLKPVDPQQIAKAIADFQANRGDAKADG
jgi:CheY-like chemotaxis protein